MTEIRAKGCFSKGLFEYKFCTVLNNKFLLFDLEGCEKLNNSDVILRSKFLYKLLDITKTEKK